MSHYSASDITQFTVLGASGFIGGHLATRLIKSGHQVYRPPRSELRSLDERRLGHVFYCLGVDDANDNPYGAFEAHIEHLVAVLRSCRFSSVTYISSTRVYLGANSSQEGAQLQILPNDRNAMYNAAKIVAEQICFASKNPSVRVARLSNVLGFAPRGISLIPMLIKDAINGRKMRLTISPQSSTDYILVDDVLDLLPRIAVEGKLHCYNVASGVNVALGEMVRIIEDEFSATAEWRAGAPAVIFPSIDISRIRSEFSFTPRSVPEAILSTCSEFRRRLSVVARAGT